MKRKYELTVIYKESDPDKKDGFSVVEGALSSHGVSVLRKEEIGSRALAYEIAKNTRGFYCFYLLEVEADEVNKISAELKLSHLILRFLFVEKDDLTPNQREKKDRKDAKIRAHLAKKAKTSESVEEQPSDSEQESKE